MIVRLLSWLVIAASIAISAALVSVPVSRLFWSLSVIVLMIAWAFITLLIKRSFRLSIIHYISTPVLLWLSTHVLILFTEEGLLQYVLIGTATLLSGLWLFTLNYTLHDKRWLVFRGNLLSYINSFIIFFTASSLYAAMIFIDAPFFWSLGIIMGLTLLLFVHIMLASHLTWHFMRLFAIISMIIIGEIFIALWVLPTSFWVKGVIVTITFYLLTGLSRCELTSIISPSLIRRYVLWGSAIVLFVLITAPWQ